MLINGIKFLGPLFSESLLTLWILFQLPFPRAFSFETNYVSFPTSSIARCTLAKAKKPSLNICLEGQATSADFQRAKLWSTRAALTWLRALKIVDQQVTRQIVFTCVDKHLTVRLKPGSGTSFASPSLATIYSTRPYGTWTHEFGHALAGLGDTYTGTAGSCGTQPQSLMCWGAFGPKSNPEEWSTLWIDDIRGIQANFRKIFQGPSTAPSWANTVDLEKSLDPQNPWPSEDFFLTKDEDSRVQLIQGPESEIDYSQDSGSIDL